MNAGLGSLRLLKSFLQAPALVDSTDFDFALLAIGRGIAEQFDAVTTRRIPRAVADTCTFGADRVHYFLPRAPLESITKVELSQDPDLGFVDVPLAGFFSGRDLRTGFVSWVGEPGEWFHQLRITYTGGYWFDESDNASGVMPALATALPSSLQLAWLLQCQHVWGQRDKLGLSLTDKPSAQPPLAQVELLPQVRDTLRPFIRYQLT